MKLRELITQTDVFIQDHALNLAARDFSLAEVAALNKGIVSARMSAYGAEHRDGKGGFDSLVQSWKGMNVSEAEHSGEGGGAVRLTLCKHSITQQAIARLSNEP